MRKKNNKVLILGGSSDIAYDLIIDLLEKNYKIDAQYNKNSLRLKKLKKNYDNLNLINLNFDKLNDKNYYTVIKKKFNKRYSVLVNLVGYTDSLSFDKTNLVKTIKSIKINFLIPNCITKLIVKNMLKKNYGRILNFSSIGIKFGGGFNNYNYSLSKHMIEFMPSIYKDWAKKNVFINCIRLGVFNTKIHKRIKNKNLKKRKKLIPVQRLGEPKDIVKLAYYLISENNTYITGEVIAVSGGE